jgi:hypothetical protein
MSIAGVTAATAAIGFTLACVPTLAGPTTTGGPSPAPQASTAPPDVVINVPAGDALVTVKIGQTIGVKPPGDGKWQVAFDAEALSLLTSSDRLEQPGPEGWVWKAVKPRQVDLVLTSKPPPCDSPPCTPNVIRFTIHLDLVAR